MSPTSELRSTADMNAKYPATGTATAIIVPAPAVPTIVAPAALQPTVAERTKSPYFLASKVASQGNVREGPGSAYGIVGEIRRGDRFLIIARAPSPKGERLWYKIRLDTGREGWVAGSLGEEIQE